MRTAWGGPGGCCVTPQRDNQAPGLTCSYLAVLSGDRNRVFEESSRSLGNQLYAKGHWTPVGQGRVGELEIVKETTKAA